MYNELIPECDGLVCYKLSRNPVVELHMSVHHSSSDLGLDRIIIDMNCLIFMDLSVSITPLEATSSQYFQTPCL